MRPPQASVPLQLRTGEEVPVVLRYEQVGAGGFGGAEVALVTFQLNLARRASDADELDRAVTLAAEADVAVVVVGTTEEVESEGFDRDALADVLCGDREPGGRLPTVWPAADHDHLPSTRPVDGRLVYQESIHVGNCAYDRAQAQPAFCFGHGLGYTTWEYLEVTAPPQLDPDGATVLSVRVRNSGARPGREVVQVYGSRPDSAVERPTRWLVGFAGASADPGQEVTVQVTVPARSLAHWDGRTHAWTIEQGGYHLAVGPSYSDERLAIEVATRS